MRGEDEVELIPGEVINPVSSEQQNESDRKEHVQIYGKLVTRERIYKLDEAIVISSSDFYEIAQACHFFASEIASKLPTKIP